MKCSSALSCILIFLVGATQAFGFGTKRAHQDLADEAIKRADANGELSKYLRDELGSRRGLDEPLALQFGLDPRIDDDLIVADDPATPAIETRLNRSLSRIDEDDNGPADRPLAPETIRVFFQENCRAAPDFDTCFANLQRADVRKLIRIGTYAEDNPNPRSRHHFHDPERSRLIVGHGLENSNVFSQSLLGTLTIEGVTARGRGGSWLRAIAGVLFLPLRPFFLDLGNFDLRGRSAADRALNLSSGLEPASDALPENLFALPDAERYLFLALTAPHEDEREHYLALHFLAVGHVLHLLQDMGSVAHVRNDFVFDHVVVDQVLHETSLEKAGDDIDIAPALLARAATRGLASLPFEYLRDHPDGSGTAPLDFFQPALAALDPTGFDAVDFWDRGAFDDPDDLDPARAGLAERVHNRFFSAGSLPNFDLLPPEFTLPRALTCGALRAQLGGGPDAVRVDELPERRLETDDQVTETGRFLTSPLVPHLARCRYHALYTEGPFLWTYSVLDESVQRDYLELLFPLVMEYTSKFLEHYLAPRLEVVAVGPGEFRLRNRTELPLRADARAVEIAYTAVDPQRPEGIRVRVPADCGSGELELLPAPAAGEAGPLSDFLCRLPESLPIPALDRADFFVLVRGTLGSRGAVAGPDDFDGLIGREDFVLAFDHVQPRILVHRATTELPDAPDKDRRFPIDVVSLPLELGRPLEPDESQAAGANLTAALRSAIGSEALDLLVPVGEPRGSRILLGSDRDATPRDPLDSDVGAALSLFLFDPTMDPADPAALRILPSSELMVPESRLRMIGVWSADGSAIFHYEDETDFSRNRLRRFNPATEESELFVEAEVFASSRDLDENPADLPLGTERDFCSGIQHLSARSAEQVVVTTECRREVVVLGSGGTGGRWTTINGTQRTEIRIAVVEASATEAGQLEGRFTARFDVGSAQVLECGLSQTCAQRGSEPSGESGSDQENPVWSPDGSKVAFLRDPEGSAGGDFRQEIWVADLVTQQLRLALPRDHGDLFDLQWSPDGRWLVFGIAEEPFDVFAIPADAGGAELPQRLTRELRPFSFSIHAPLRLPDGA